MNRWQVLKDVLLTGTGVAVILSQIFSPRPSDILLVTGLALTAPSIAVHARELLGGHTGSSSSARQQESGHGLPSSSSEAGRE